MILQFTRLKLQITTLISLNSGSSVSLRTKHKSTCFFLLFCSQWGKIHWGKYHFRGDLISCCKQLEANFDVCSRFVFIINLALRGYILYYRQRILKRKTNVLRKTLTSLFTFITTEKAVVVMFSARVVVLLKKTATSQYEPCSSVGYNKLNDTEIIAWHNLNSLISTKRCHLLTV